MNIHNLNSPAKRLRYTLYIFGKDFPYYDIVFVAFSVFYFVFSTHLWLKTNGIPGYMFTNVDELYLTYLYTVNWEQFGILNLCFLPDYATGLDPVSHPFVYTHNIAFPNYVAYLIRLLGFPEIYYLSLVSMFVSYAGYSLAYWLFRRFINPHVGIIVFCLIILDYDHVLSHSHTFFRSFQWVLFFLCPILFLEWQNSKRSTNSNRHSKCYKLAFGFSIGLTAAYEHALLFQSVFTISMLYLYFNPNPFKKSEWVSLSCVSGISILTPFLLYFVCQVIYWRDPYFALIDQFGTYANRLIGYPDYIAIKEIYKNRNIVNYSYPASSMKDILGNFPFIFKWFFVEYGMLSFIGMVSVFVLNLFSMLKKGVFRNTFVSITRILNCFLYPMLLFVFVTPYYIRSNYIGASLPLFEIYFTIFKGFIFYITFYYLYLFFKSQTFRVLSALIVVGLVAKNITNDYFTNPPIPMPASDVLRKYEGHSFSVNYHAQYPAIFTKQWAVSAALPNSFVNEDSILNKDAPLNKEKYLKPEYYLDLYMKSQNFHPEQIKALAPKAVLVESDWNYQIWKLNW